MFPRFRSEHLFHIRMSPIFAWLYSGPNRGQSPRASEVTRNTVSVRISVVRATPTTAQATNPGGQASRRHGGRGGRSRMASRAKDHAAANQTDPQTTLK